MFSIKCAHAPEQMAVIEIMLGSICNNDALFVLFVLFWRCQIQFVNILVDQADRFAKSVDSYEFPKHINDSINSMRY